MFSYSEEEPAPNSVVEEYLQEKRKYEDKRKQQPKKGVSREDQVIISQHGEKKSGRLLKMFVSVVFHLPLKESYYL